MSCNHKPVGYILSSGANDEEKTFSYLFSLLGIGFDCDVVCRISTGRDNAQWKATRLFGGLVHSITHCTHYTLYIKQLWNLLWKSS